MESSPKVMIAIIRIARRSNKYNVVSRERKNGRVKQYPSLETLRWSHKKQGAQKKQSYLNLRKTPEISFVSVKGVGRNNLGKSWGRKKLDNFHLSFLNVREHFKSYGGAGDREGASFLSTRKEQDL